MSSEDRGRSSYLDLLIATLMEHEKNLDRLVGRLEKIEKNLSTARERRARAKTAAKEKGKVAESDLDTLIYMKLKIGRQVDEIVKIIESLKE